MKWLITTISRGRQKALIVYAHTAESIDYSELQVPEVIVKKLGFDDLNQHIEQKLGRRIVALVFRAKGRELATPQQARELLRLG